MTKIILRYLIKLFQQNLPLYSCVASNGSTHTVTLLNGTDISFFINLSTSSFWEFTLFISLKLTGLMLSDSSEMT